MNKPFTEFLICALAPEQGSGGVNNTPVTYRKHLSRNDEILSNKRLFGSRSARQYKVDAFHPTRLTPIHERSPTWASDNTQR